MHLAPLNLPDTQVSRDQGHYLPPTHSPNLELEDRKEQGRERRGGRSRKGGGEEARGAGGERGRQEQEEEKEGKQDEERGFKNVEARRMELRKTF